MTPDPRFETIRRVIRDGHLNTAQTLLAQMQDEPEARLLLLEVQHERRRLFALQQQRALAGKEDDWEDEQPREPHTGSGDATRWLNVLSVLVLVGFVFLVIYLTSIDQASSVADEQTIRMTVAAIPPRLGSNLGSGRSASSGEGSSPSTSRNPSPVSGLSAAQTTRPTVRTAAAVGQPTTAQVIRIVSPDEIEVSIAGQSARVTYLGIAGPEEGARCFDAAATFSTRLLSGKTVRLESGADEADRTGRLFRYVFVDGDLMNATLLRAGYATMLNLDTRERYAAEMERAESDGRRLQAGCYRNNGFLVTTGTAPVDSSQPYCDRNSCRDFTSRDELNNYLLSCPLDFPKFDLDGDGRPCWTQEDAP